MSAAHLMAVRDLIGIPYRRGAQGPDAIDCWALVRVACQRLHGAAPPLLAGPVTPVVRGAVAQGWRQADAPAHGDILVMRTAQRDRHTGLVLNVRHRLQLLHAVEGGSVLQPLDDLPLLGFSHLQAWRLTA